MDGSAVMAVLAIVVVVLRELAPLVLKKMGKNGNGTAGAKSPEFWQLTMKQVVRESMSELLLPHLQVQTDILRDIREELRRK